MKMTQAKQKYKSFNIEKVQASRHHQTTQKQLEQEKETVKVVKF